MITSVSRAPIAVILLATLLVAPGVQAQQAEQQQAPPPAPPAGTGKKVAAAEEQTKPSRSFLKALFVNLGDDIKHIPRKNTLYWLGGGGALALAVHQKDEKINDSLSNSDSAKNFFTAGKYVGSFPVLIGISATTYIVGRTRPSNRAKHLGMDLIEATLLADGMTQIIKVAVRRQRPLQDDGTRAPGFAFPSGHAAGTFAAATVLQQHLGWKWAVPTYALGTYVAISRLADDRHWASDVVAGATEGIIVGRSVTWHGRNFYASPMLLPKGAGIMVAVNNH